MGAGGHAAFQIAAFRIFTRTDEDTAVCGHTGIFDRFDINDTRLYTVRGLA